MKILIPAYKPNKKIINLINEIIKLTNVSIIVIDDGSGKEYKKIFDKLKLLQNKVTVIEHKTNRGKGEAIKTGIKYLIDIEENEGVVTADCDGQHTPKDIVKIIEELRNTKNDLVLGVRNFDNKNVPRKSKYGNKISRVLFRAMTGEKIRDTQTGLRGYSSNIFDWLVKVKGNRHDYEFNILLGINEKGLNYSEVEIETVYEDNNKNSNFRAIRDSILIYKPVCKFILSSTISAIYDFVLLLVFENIFNNLLISVILSRIMSSILNFILNRNYVFENKQSNIIKTFIKYYALVIIILIFNYGILYVLYKVLRINLVISKIITEIVLYSFSFIVQKRIVFKKGRR